MQPKLTLTIVSVALVLTGLVFSALLKKLLKTCGRRRTPMR